MAIDDDIRVLCCDFALYELITIASVLVSKLCSFIHSFRKNSTAFYLIRVVFKRKL